MSTNIEVCQNTDKFCSFEDFQNFLEKAKQSSKLKILIGDLILILLFSHKDKPIYGRTMLIKQLFLVYKEIFPNFDILYEDPHFFAHNFGPYSQVVMDVVEDLWISNSIIINGRKNTTKESFQITDFGSIRAENKFERLPQNLKDTLKNQRIGWDQLGHNGIIDYVYAKYPDMTINSKIKNKHRYNWVSNDTLNKN